MKRGWRGAMVLGLLQLAATMAIAGPDGARPAPRWRADAGAPLGMFERSRAGAFADSPGIPRDRLIDMVQRRFNARVVRVNLVESDGRRIYEMRLMSAQRVWNVRVDAETGQVLGGGN